MLGSLSKNYLSDACYIQILQFIDCSWDDGAS